MNKYWYALLAGLLTQSVHQAYAFESFVVEDIKIQGLQRIAEGTVINYLPVNIGDVMTEGRSGEILKALFNTGFFQDIQLGREGNALVIELLERPTIGKITITGNKDITSDNLKATLKETGLAEGHVFDRSTLEMVRNELERMYFGHGKYSVKIDSVVTEQDKNRVNIEITIVEGQAARIKAIHIIGNRDFKTEELLKEFALAQSHCFSWVSRSDQYDKEKLSADLEKLRTFYLDRGYLNFQITSTQVTITPDKLDIYVTVNIQEGQPFTVGKISLAGTTILPEAELMQYINLKQGEIFSRTKVAKIVEALNDRLGQEGYSNANVNPVPDVHDSEHVADITFYVEPGNRMQVRRILFEGNTKTKDEVLRRELIQMESAVVNTLLIEDSRTRLNRTGYFKEVKVDLKPVPGVSDEVDVIYTVQEASAGQLGGGIGYSDSDGIVFNANISNRNFLGTGNSTDFSFNQSKAYKTYNLSYNNPYYTIDGVSRGFSVYYSETDLSRSSSVSDYTTDAWGGNVNYSYPISPVDRISFGLGYQSTKLAVGDAFNAPKEIENFLTKNGNNSDEVTAALGWSHNTFDRYLFPENGLRQGASLSVSVPSSTLQYYRMTYDVQWYKSLFKGFIFTASGLLGYGDGYGKTSALPFYRHFYAGGSSSVRGFEDNSLGPKDSHSNPFGGNFLVTGSTGLVIPNEWIGNIPSVRAQLFLDAGQVYDSVNRYYDDNKSLSRNPKGLRYSAGVSVTWVSPLAPLVFSYGIPLRPTKDRSLEFDRNADKVKRFSFTFGTVF